MVNNIFNLRPTRNTMSVQCPCCGVENPDGSPYCRRCGMALLVDGRPARRLCACVVMKPELDRT